MNRLAPTLLVLLTLIVFGRVCFAEFVEWDDPSTITRDAAFNPPTLSSIANYWRAPQMNIYIPLTCTVWGALAAIGRLAQPDETGSLLNPWIFHTANLLVHLINVLLIWTIAKSLTRNRAASWIAAAIFAVHPVQVEAVAWATDMKDLLCAGFSFAAILGWIEFRTRPHARRSAFILATLALLAACLSKPTGLVTPLIVLIIDTMLLDTKLRRSLIDLSVWFVIAGIFAIVAKVVQPPVMASVAPVVVRPLIAADAIAFYLWKLIWPAKLAIDYGRTPTRAIAQGWIAFTWIAPAVIAAILCCKHAKKESAGALIFVAALFPVLGLVPFTFQSLSTVADHYLYLPMLGVCIAIAFALRTTRSRAIFVLAGIVIAALSVRSFAAAGVWHDNDRLFENAIDVNPRSAMSYTNWAVALAHRGDTNLAIADLRHAIDIDPDYAFAHLNLAGLLLARNDRQAALREFREVLRIYQTQRNYDPTLAEEVERKVAAMTASGVSTGKSIRTTREAR